MTKIKFLLQSQSDPAPIYLRLTLSKTKVLKRKTGLVISPRLWDSKPGSAGWPKTSSRIEKDKAAANRISSKLRKLDDFILDEINQSNAKGEEITGTWLTRRIEAHFNRAEENDLNLLVNYGEEFIKKLSFRKNKRTGKEISEATKKKYRTIVNKLQAFEEYQGQKYALKDVGGETDDGFGRDLITYLSKIEKLNDNTIGRYLKFVKSICLKAKREGFQTHPRLEDFNGFVVEAPTVTLSFDELEQIKKTDLASDTLEIARDWLIIGCYTGQRASDLFRMKKSFVKSIEGFQFIELRQVKTDKPVTIPIHSEVKKVLDKRNGEFPPLYSESFESNKTMFNRYLKKVCEIAEINAKVEGNLYNEKTERTERGFYEKHKLVSSHICRRSFATNFYGQEGYPTPLLMNITAHSTEQMFLTYIGVSPKDQSLQLAKIWAKEALKEKKESNLKVVDDSKAG